MIITVDGVTIQGQADLVYESEGGLVVVDFKTDTGVDAAVLRERYELQLGCYALAFESVCRLPVHEAVLVGTGLGDPAASEVVCVPVAVDDGLRRRVRARIGEVARKGELAALGQRYEVSSTSVGNLTIEGA